MAGRVIFVVYRVIPVADSVLPVVGRVIPVASRVIPVAGRAVIVTVTVMATVCIFITDGSLAPFVQCLTTAVLFIL